jgi:hypothetical protein
MTKEENSFLVTNDHISFSFHSILKVSFTGSLPARQFSQIFV